MEANYAGITGNLQISNNSIKIKDVLIQGDFYIPHIEYIEIVPLRNRRSKLEIIANGMTFFIVFYDEKSELYNELYYFLLPYIERIHFNASEDKLIIYNKLNCQKTGSLKIVNKTTPTTTIPINKIINCELIDNIHNPNTSLRDTASATIVGGGAAGLAAAYASTFSNGLSIKLTIDDNANPVLYIHYIAYPIKKKSNMMKAMIDMCDRDFARLQAICKKNNKNSLESQPEVRVDPIEEVKKFKELLDLGILSQEEFDKKKKELLSL